MGFQSAMFCLVVEIGVYAMSLMQSAFLLAGRLIRGRKLKFYPYILRRAGSTTSFGDILTQEHKGGGGGDRGATVSDPWFSHL